MVVMMDIDDTSFRNHEHYPKDLVDWVRARNAYCQISLFSASIPSAAALTQ